MTEGFKRRLATLEQQHQDPLVREIETLLLELLCYEDGEETVARIFDEVESQPETEEIS